MASISNSYGRVRTRPAPGPIQVCAGPGPQRVGCHLTPGGRRAEGQEQGQGVVARRGLRRANGGVRAVPAASGIAGADHLAGQVGGHQRPGPQQESEEGEPARSERGAIQEVLRLDEVVEDRTRVDCQQFLWITSVRPGKAANRDKGLRGAAGLREK